MKKILISSILTLLVSVSLSAKEPFIQVMSISDSSYLNSVKSDIHKLGYKTYVNKRGKWHIVYAGPFKNNTEASKALNVIKRGVSKDAFLTKIKIATPKQKVKKQIVPVQKKVVVAPVKVQEKKKIVKKVAPEKIVPTKKQATLYSAQQKDVTPKVDVQEKKKVATEVVASQKAIIPVQQNAEPKKEQKEKGFYIGLTTGYSIVDVTKNDISGNMTLNFELEDSGINYGAEVGYYFNNNVFISINYQKTDLEHVSLNNAFATLNYQFDETYSFSPYIGAIAGYNIVTWEKSPIDSATENGSASSLLGGLQVGSDISLYGGVSLYVFYRYLMFENITNIETLTEKSKIEYSSEQNLNIGIKYIF